MSEAQELEKLRLQIDSLDKQIHELINQRAQCAQDVAVVKHKYAKPGEHVVFYRPEREAQVLRNVMERNKGPLSDKARSEEHTSELQSRPHLVCRLLLEKKKKKITNTKE